MADWNDTNRIANAALIGSRDREAGDIYASSTRERQNLGDGATIFTGLLGGKVVTEDTSGGVLGGFFNRR